MASLMHGSHQLAFLLRRDAAKHRIALRSFSNVPITGQRPGIYKLIRIGDLRPSGYLCDRHRVVPRNDLYGHSLLPEVAEGGRSLRADLVGQQDKAQRRDLTYDRAVIQFSVVACQQEHAAAKAGILLDLLLIFAVELAHDILRGAKQIGLPF